LAGQIVDAVLQRLSDDVVRMQQSRDLDGTSSRPFGGRGINVVSATSCAIAMLAPPSNWIRSAIASTDSFCRS